MRLVKAIIENFKGINTPIEIAFSDFNCIVGKNDVGKSTILKAVDTFINENNPTADDKNIYNESKTITIELMFDCQNQQIILDDAINVTFEEEELVNDGGLLCVKKTWDISQKTIKPKVFILRKRYDTNDFLSLDEKALIKLCKELKIETSKGNGEEYNNKEKRGKLREYNNQNSIVSNYVYDELPTSGATRLKKISDAVKLGLPTFEYFKADSSLSDSDTSVQKYFREKAQKLLKEVVDTSDVEEKIRTDISEAFARLTQKINSIVSAEEQVEADINIDWSKLISTSFKCKKEEANIPLTSRGDGFRRITMMSYFEMLAEEKNDSTKKMTFGFEEPETFLHPETQKQLHNRLMALKDNGYQVFVTTHSPNIVTETDIDNVIFISRNETNEYVLTQGSALDIKRIVEELGIKSNDIIFTVFDRVKCLFLVEGPDDVMAMTHTVNKYKSENKVDNTFEELGVMMIPIGGCDAIKHWVNFEIIKKLNKPFFILLDSDKESEEMESPNIIKLQALGYSVDNYCVLKKRQIECYIPYSYFNNFDDPIVITYGDWDNVKKLCGQHQDNGRLGGKGVCDRHFSHLTFNHLRFSFCPDENDANDEFLDIFNKVTSKIDN